MLGITYVREKNNITITELAEKLQISKQAISQWEKEIDCIPSKRLKQLSELFKVPEEYFLLEMTMINKIKIDTFLNGDSEIEYYINLRKVLLLEAILKIINNEGVLEKYEKFTKELLL